jgi:hypothetical protein
MSATRAASWRSRSPGMPCLCLYIQSSRIWLSSSLSVWACAALACAALAGALAQPVEVGTAAELRDALINSRPHIILTDHLDLRDWRVEGYHTSNPGWSNTGVLADTVQSLQVCPSLPAVCQSPQHNCCLHIFYSCFCCCVPVVWLSPVHTLAARRCSSRCEVAMGHVVRPAALVVVLLPMTRDRRPRRGWIRQTKPLS